MSGHEYTKLAAKTAVAPLRFRTYLGLTESVIRALTQRSEKPQLFIVGPPRSGTTLIYQYIVHRLQIAYFTNGVGRYPVAPCLVTWAQRLFRRDHVSDFASQYGKVEGAIGPREAGGFWNRYFDAEAYQDAEALSHRKAERLRRTIWCVQRTFGDIPFVNKNVKHLLRLMALQDIFPKSVFLFVERDLTDAALSMLRARRHLFGDPGHWFSIRPPDYETLRSLDPVDQIVGQYHSIVRKMEADLEGIPQGRKLRVSYNDFCHSPEELIGRIIELLGHLEYRNPPIDSFPVINNSSETREEFELVEKIGGR
jgi:hypothetical protein